MATNQSRLVRRVLKKTLVPVFEDEGFQGKFTEFQRHEKGELHLLSVTFDKHGGGFFLEFAKHPMGDLKTDWGEVILERELTVAHAPFDSRARLQQRGHPNSLSEDWFRFEDLCEKGGRSAGPACGSLVPSGR